MIDSSVTSVLGCKPLPSAARYAQRLDGGAGLAHRLRGAIELAQRVGEAAGHRQDAAGLVLQDDHRALHLRAHPQLGARGALALALVHMHQHHIVERELALGGGVVDRERQDASVSEADAPSLVLSCRWASPAPPPPTSARHRAAAAQPPAPAARPAACRCSSCPPRCAVTAFARLASAARNCTRPALRS